MKFFFNCNDLFILEYYTWLQNQCIQYNQMYYLIYYKTKSKLSKVGHLRTQNQ